MIIKRFEDIQAWQEARILTRMIYAVTQDSAFAHDVRLCGQIEGAPVSSMANIAEGFDGGTDAEFARFLQLAKRSASEVQSHAYVALDQRYIAQDQFDAIYQQAAKTKNFTAFKRYLRNNPRPNAPTPKGAS